MVNNDSYDQPSLPSDSFEFQAHSVANRCVNMNRIYELRRQFWGKKGLPPRTEDNNSQDS